jgi:uncharacterized protein (TIGR02466 family)
MSSIELQPGDSKFRHYFGPPILEVKLPDEVFSRLEAITNTVLNVESPVRYGANLAGAVHDELVIPKQDLKDAKINDFFEKVGNHFVITACDSLNAPSLSAEEASRVTTQITNMWVVRQRENEYNPLHIHTGSTISAVMYLKVPEFKDRNIPYKRYKLDDGKITFVHKSAGDPASSFERSLLTIEPEVGTMYLFPSTLLHTVYPFVGDGERVSVSFNMIHTMKDVHTIKDDSDKGSYKNKRTKWFYPKGDKNGKN